MMFYSEQTVKTSARLSSCFGVATTKAATVWLRSSGRPKVQSRSLRAVGRMRV